VKIESDFLSPAQFRTLPPTFLAYFFQAPDISNDKADKFGDGDVVEYDYTSDNGADSQGSGSSASDTSRFQPQLTQPIIFTIFTFFYFYLGHVNPGNLLE
jgi:hypothetical protein